MFSTKTLSSLKGIFPLVHHQLPLNQRESQQLLNCLTTSFRKHLDKEHGWLQDDSHAPPKRQPGLSSEVSSLIRGSSISKDAHRRPTDNHLRTILSNPLFSYDRSSQAEVGSGAAERDPMDVFDEAVAKGLMTPRRATGCLFAKKRQLVESPSLSIKGAMATSDASHRVVQWLRASGMERDLSFLTNTGLTDLLVTFMVAEGMQDLVWTWVERAMQAEAANKTCTNHGASHLVYQLSRAQAFDSSTLDPAYNAILYGEERLKNHSLFDSTFSKPWHKLAWASTVEAWRRSAPSEGPFESFMALGKRLHMPAGIATAHLELHHPTQPRHAHAVRLLDGDKLWRMVARSSEPSSEADRNSRSANSLAIRVMSLGLDAVQHLTRLDRASEAQWILKLLQRHFSGEFGTDAAQFSRAVAPT